MKKVNAPYPTLALTGTPGTGKSSAARALLDIVSREGFKLRLQKSRASRVRSFTVMEVSELALRLGHGHYEPGGTRWERLLSPVEVDLPSLSAAFKRLLPSPRPFIVVGHLSHLLPVDATLLLRCNPRELARRLETRGDLEKDIRENVEAELVDVVLFEALERKAPVYEHDTTSETPVDTARWILRVLAGSESSLSTSPPFNGNVDWLADDDPLPGGNRKGRKLDRANLTYRRGN
jgi:adenylate kinase